MALHNGNTQKMLALIKLRGKATSRELYEHCGVPSNNQPGLLDRYLDDGTLETEIVRLANGTGQRSYNLRLYHWRAGTRPVAAVMTAKAPTGPQASGLRKCLAADCGRLFQSASAANRICPRCKAAAERSAARLGHFDTPHVVLNP